MNASAQPVPASRAGNSRCLVTGASGTGKSAGARRLPPHLPEAVAASYNGGEDNVARWLERAANLDHVPAMIELGIAVFNGDGVQREADRIGRHHSEHEHGRRQRQVLAETPGGRGADRAGRRRLEGDAWMVLAAGRTGLSNGSKRTCGL